MNKFFAILLLAVIAMVQGAPKAEPQFIAAPISAAYVQPSAAVVERSYHGNFAYPQYVASANYVASPYVASPYVASPYVASPYTAAYTAPILYR